MNQSYQDALNRLDEPVDSVTAAETGAIDDAAVWRALATVIDPEIGLDIVTLGLVYGVDCSGGTARVTFSLTTPGCPMGGVITAGIEGSVAAVPGVEEVEPVLVWKPHWHPGMIREGAW
jgi:metal-sulfur cluster biosynthetic enzyme